MSEEADLIRRLEDEVLRQRQWLERFSETGWLPPGGSRLMAKWAKKALDGEVYQPPPPPPEMVCSICKVPESESDLGVLMEVQVITNQGEEGYSDVTMKLCDHDLQDILEALRKLGFRDHNHGGTAFLQDEDCPGAKYDPQTHYLLPCPTPTDPYKGTYIVGNYALSSGRKEDDDD